MKLKKLEITGFKSFFDKSSIEFPPGISAVVGPNGCGKSNIVDALRWVMGEQSVKQLRGKSMEDVIFSGTNGKPPLNMAEVNLLLSNDNGSTPEDYRDFAEIMLTRRLYRSGESAYFINKQPCRLKDIHNVFLGSGIATKSYAVIQQGNIGAIIDAGPEERRGFLEEAAGITRYKNRKNEALRKVASTKQNLLRVSDIMAEVKRQMNGLKRQARKAERYNKYQGQIKTLDVILALNRYDTYTLQLNETDTLLNELKDSDIEQSAKLKKLDASVEEIKLKRSQKDQEISEQKSRQFDMQRTADRVENDLVHMRSEIVRLTEESDRITGARGDLEEKNRSIDSEIQQVQNQSINVNQQIETVTADLENEREVSQEINHHIAMLNQEMDTCKNQLMNCVAQEAKYKNIYQTASDNRQHLKKRFKRLEEEKSLAAKKVTALQTKESKAKETLVSLKADIEDINQQIHQVQEDLTAKSRRLGKQVKRVQTMDYEFKEIRSRYSALKRMEGTFEWYKEGVKAIMTLHKTKEQPNGIIGLVADTIEAEPDYATAVEAVLGDALQYILVENQEIGTRSIGHLQSSGTGRSGFIPVSTIKHRYSNQKETSDHVKHLTNYVSAKSGFEDITETLLGNVVVVNDIKEALETWNQNNGSHTIVTKSGEIISPEGIMVGGSSANGSGILAKKREIKALEQQNTQQEQELAAARKVQEALESDVIQVETNLQKLIEQKNDTSIHETEAEKAHYRISEDLKYALRHLEVVDLESEQLMGEEIDLDEQLSSIQQAIAEAEQEVTASQNRVVGITKEIDIASAKMNDYSQRIVDFKLQLTTLNAKLENSATNLRRLKAFQEDSTQRLTELSQEISQKNAKRIDLKQRVFESEQTLSDMYEDLKLLENLLSENRTNFQNYDNKLRENDAVINDIQGKREETLEKIRLLELEQSQRHLRQENIVDQIETRYHSSLYELRESFDVPADMNVEDTESRLSELRHRISRIDDVNLSAIKEYETLKERYDFLVEQQDDLVQAIEDLHKVIRRINRITRERFMTTFHSVNEKLKEVFPRLFEGGTAQMVLTEPDNPLETGVEYMIHPPGKKLTRMSLLSGGEKALSAIAFIFSIYLLKPTAFCLLDEIDAPLDDVNVFRFNNLLQLIGEKSQIIMITHNKNTMEFADMLFGVTMENKGVSKIVSVNFN